MNAPIELRNVEKSYPHNLTKKKILHGISLSIQSGEVFGFIGPNGAGKSTTINLLMGFTRPDGGLVRIHGREPSEPASREMIGYLPEGPRYYENLKATELLRFSCSMAGMKSKGLDGAIDGLLGKLEILHVKNSPISTYSKGMKQRLGLALSMIHDPQTLVLDEPMSGLDPVGRDLLKRIILDLKERGKTIFFSSHILNDVETLCDRIGLIHKGRILYNGPALEFRSRAEDIDAAFVRRIETASEGNPSHE
jgi:ABC-2 type transport system ATP-binding protein